MTDVKKYTKRPVTVEAVQWDGTAAGATPIIDWIVYGRENSTQHRGREDNKAGNQKSAQ